MASIASNQYIFILLICEGGMQAPYNVLNTITPNEGSFCFGKAAVTISNSPQVKKLEKQPIRL